MEYYLHLLNIWVLKKRIARLRGYVQRVEVYLVESERLIKHLERKLARME